MKRRYRAKIIGDGVFEEDDDGNVITSETTGPYRPAIAEYSVSWVAASEIQSDENGHPIDEWIEVIVDASNSEHKNISNDPLIQLVG